MRSVVHPYQRVSTSAYIKLFTIAHTPMRRNTHSGPSVVSLIPPPSGVQYGYQEISTIGHLDVRANSVVYSLFIICTGCLAYRPSGELGPVKHENCQFCS